MDGEGIIPIFIGVTGHRDLIIEDIPNLEEKVKAIVAHVKATCPHSPIKILSPLADGADRLVAKVGLQMGLSLICPLPLPKSEYMRDFKTDESKKEFGELIGRAETVIELPFVYGNTPENIKEYDEPRNIQYASVGACIAAHSQILIALWNGKDNKEVGGTAEIVRFKLEGIPVPYAVPRSPLDLPDNGPVYHIFTKRKEKDIEVTENNHKPQVDCLPIQKENWNVLYPIGWKTGEISRAEKYYGRILKKIDDFNKDAKSWTSESNVKKSMSSLFPENEDAILIRGLKEMRSCYGFADAIAQYYQKKTTMMLKGVISTAVVAFFFFGVFDGLWSRTYVLALFPAFFCITYLIYKHAVKKNYENKFYDYRAFAEGLRVQFFWKLICSKFNVTDHYQRKYKGEMDWIFHALRNVSIKANLEILKNPVIDKKIRLDKTQKCWVEDQSNYFKNNAVKRKAIAEKQERFTYRFFTVAMALVFGIFIMKAIILFQQGSLGNILNMEDVKEWKIYSVFLVLIDTFIAIGAARALYVEKRAFNDEAKQFQRMKDLFVRGSKVMTESLEKNDLDSAENVIIELGKEALTENGDWLILQRSKPMEMPIG